jgi:hypothetical protein
VWAAVAVAVAVERLVEQVVPEFGRIDGALAIYRGGSEARQPLVNLLPRARTPARVLCYSGGT